jgi:very-short-patch-repair endonuclease
VYITCKIHGLFKQRPTDHLAGSICKKCSDSEQSLTKEEFIKKAITIHGTKYDYNLVDYKNNRTDIIIICPNHGEFKQNPSNHIDCNCGCPFCYNIYEGLVWNFLKEEEFKLTHQFKNEWCKNINKLPFDILINDYNIIIEIDDNSHFTTDNYKLDCFKTNCANKNGYHTIRIAQNNILNDNYEWQDKLIELINYLKNSKQVQNLYMYTTKGKYYKHKFNDIKESLRNEIINDTKISNNKYDKLLNIILKKSQKHYKQLLS